MTQVTGHIKRHPIHHNIWNWLPVAISSVMIIQTVFLYASGKGNTGDHTVADAEYQIRVLYGMVYVMAGVVSLFNVFISFVSRCVTAGFKW